MAKHHITFYVSLKKSEKITFSDYEFAVYLFLQFPKDIYLVIKSYCHCDSFLNVLHSFCVQLAGRTSIIYEWSYFFNTTSA